MATFFPLCRKMLREFHCKYPQWSLEEPLSSQFRLYCPHNNIRQKGNNRRNGDQIGWESYHFELMRLIPSKPFLITFMSGMEGKIAEKMRNSGSGQAVRALELRRRLAVHKVTSIELTTIKPETRTYARASINVRWWDVKFPTRFTATTGQTLSQLPQ